MKKIGIALIATGVALLFLALSIETTVESAFGDRRIYNIGLMQQQQNALLIAALVVVVGVLVLGFNNGGANVVEKANEEKLLEEPNEKLTIEEATAESESRKQLTNEDEMKLPFLEKLKRWW